MPIALTGPPQTEERLCADLARLGVRSGTTLMVHCSLSAIGWVVGGPPTVVRALVRQLGPGGTLVMPAATPHCADPVAWLDPAVPADWLQLVRENLPVFDSQTTPTSLGAIPETFRNWPGTERSRHPLESVCARGPHAAAVTGEHSLEFSEGPGGPFGGLHELDAWVLLLGVGFNRCTALHFAETLSAKRRVATVRFPVVEAGRRIWREVPNVADDNDTHFPVIGQRYLATGRPTTGSVGNARATLFPMRDLVEFALAYFEATL